MAILAWSKLGLIIFLPFVFVLTIKYTITLSAPQSVYHTLSAYCIL